VSCSAIPSSESGSGAASHPNRGEHVFANIQSLHEANLARIAPDAFDVVIVDEFHHAAGATYDRLLRHVRPKILVGLTATPERTDGRSVLGWFDGRIAAELRLWKALDQGLLSPFQYFGVNDGTNLSTVRWTPTGYDVEQLRNVYTGNDLWIRRVLQEVSRRVADPGRMRALGFCVDIAHAEYVAARFCDAGLPSVAVSQRTSASDRADALRRLQAGELRAVFSVDLFNEGVDVPDVDTVLFLRPTESATLFLQQLGRGLRRRPDKDCLTVLDFIGGAHRRFRFDARFRAIVGGTRQQIIRDVERGFPRLPSGCSIQLDRVAAEIVIDNIKVSLGRGDEGLVEDLRAIGRNVDLATFLNETGLDLEDVYARSGRSFTRLRRRAGLPTSPAQDAEVEERLERALARLLHVDDPARLAGYAAIVAATTASAAGEDPLARMLFAALGWMKRPLGEMSAEWDELPRAPAIADELRQLFSVLDDRRGLTYPLDGRLASLPLQVHATYVLDEVMAAIDERDRNGCIRRLREGVYHAKALRADLLFVTLDKTEADYSPTTITATSRSRHGAFTGRRRAASTRTPTPAAATSRTRRTGTRSSSSSASAARPAQASRPRTSSSGRALRPALRRATDGDRVGARSRDAAVALPGGQGRGRMTAVLHAWTTTSSPRVPASSARPRRRARERAREAVALPRRRRVCPSRRRTRRTCGARTQPVNPRAP
jgi:hypothetical protein